MSDWGRRASVAAALAAHLALPAQAQEARAPSFRPLPAPTLNFYGSPGLIDMPSGEMMADGQFTLTTSWFAGTTRLTASFQALPWLSGSFRYNAIQSLNLFGFQTYYDRGFDVRFRLHQETRVWPQITLGLQDFVGTGVYAGEYIVATKTFATPGFSPGSLPGRLKITAGLGWGRLGSHGSIGAPFSATRPTFVGGSTGGQISYNQWFRGPVAPFGGVEWQLNDRWGIKAEYSSDAYRTETKRSSVFQRKSNFNFGLEYQATQRTRIGAYYLYGSELGVTAQIQLNPHHPIRRLALPAPQPVTVRVPRVENPLAWSDDWAAAPDSLREVRARIAPQLIAQGLLLESLTLTGDTAELRFRNERYWAMTVAAGRAARVLAAQLPPSVETFRLVPVAGGMALSAIELRRSDLEALEFDAMSTEALRAVAGIGEAPPLAGYALPGEVYPRFNWSVGPYFEPAYFDPAQPLRMDVGVEATAAWEPGPGWLLAGTLRHRLGGNVKNGRASNSVLPHVRTDQVSYAQTDTALYDLYASYQWRPGRNLYARVTAGLLERMYGGVSAELLWKPVDSRLALGIEGNYVRQRDFDGGFGFRNYAVATGHATAYLEMGRGYVAQVSAGRYLAGDVGGTVSIDRTFANGWSVGGWFTLTNVSAARFGEGSFDKGVRFNIPVNWFLGKPSQQSVGLGIRPIQRDGGQRLSLPVRLYGQVRQAHARALEAEWARVWE